MPVRWLGVGILRQREALSVNTCAFTRESAPLLVRWLGVSILRLRVAVSGLTCAFTRESVPIPVRWLGVGMLRRIAALSGVTCARTRGSALPATLRVVGTLLHEGTLLVFTASASTAKRIELCSMC
jgi:hypothetical protein